MERISTNDVDMTSSKFPPYRSTFLNMVGNFDTTVVVQNYQPYFSTQFFSLQNLHHKKTQQLLATWYHMQWNQWYDLCFCQRPYYIEYTRSHPNSEVKLCKARSVLGWGTAWEALRVPLALLLFHSLNFFVIKKIDVWFCDGRFLLYKIYIIRKHNNS